MASSYDYGENVSQGRKVIRRDSGKYGTVSSESICVMWARVIFTRCAMTWSKEIVSLGAEVQADAWAICTCTISDPRAARIELSSALEQIRRNGSTQSISAVRDRRQLEARQAANSRFCQRREDPIDSGPRYSNRERSRYRTAAPDAMPHRRHPLGLRRPDRELPAPNPSSGGYGARTLSRVVRDLPLPGAREGDARRVGARTEPEGVGGTALGGCCHSLTEPNWIQEYRRIHRAYIDDSSVSLWSNRYSYLISLRGRSRTRA